MPLFPYMPPPSDGAPIISVKISKFEYLHEGPDVGPEVAFYMHLAQPPASHGFRLTPDTFDTVGPPARPLKHHFNTRRVTRSCEFRSSSITQCDCNAR